MLGKAPMVEIPEIDPNVDAMMQKSQQLLATPWFQMNLGQQKQAAAAPTPQSNTLPGNGLNSMADQFNQFGAPQQSTRPAVPEPGPNASPEEWLRYKNQEAIRNKPLSPELVQAMSFLPEMGVEMHVISGGETEDRKASNSGRHLHGNSADADFYHQGRKLDWNNQSDVPIFQEIVKRSRANGITGIGAGDDYMGAGRLHIGFGKEAVWGAGGKGENAAGWLKDAWYS